MQRGELLQILKKKNTLRNTDDKQPFILINLFHLHFFFSHPFFFFFCHIELWQNKKQQKKKNFGEKSSTKTSSSVWNSIQFKNESTFCQIEKKKRKWNIKHIFVFYVSTAYCVSFGSNYFGYIWVIFEIKNRIYSAQWLIGRATQFEDEASIIN